MPEWKETKIHVDGADLKVMEAGEGKPLLVLHDELGPTAWLKWHEALSAHRRLIMPVQPGFRGERTGWIRNVRDVSVMYGHMLRALKVGKADVIGFSFGGWIAAEMAVNNPDQFSKMALVAPFGIQPDTGFIMDFFPMTSADYIKSSVRNPESVAEFATLYGAPGPEQFEAMEDARTECARLAWEPFMFDPSLPALLGGVDSVPTTIFWGADDAILPESAVRIYERSIKGAQVQVFKNCGHRPEIEAQADFTKALVRFLD
jgi:pimeloyl-ACP methyl ester carboxylesterase